MFKKYVDKFKKLEEEEPVQYMCILGYFWCAIIILAGVLFEIITGIKL